MILERWAENLLSACAQTDIADLHMRDTVAAFFAGLPTQEGQSLAHMSGKKTLQSDHVAGKIAGIARLSECDDIHLSACVTPGAAVIPAALMLAANDPETFARAVAAGYAAGIMLGRAAGANKALAHGVWPSLLAAASMAAVVSSVARGDDARQLARVLAYALQITDGRPTGQPQPLRRWILFAQAVSAGIIPDTANADVKIFSKSWLAGKAGHDAVDMSVLEGPLPSLSGVGFKPFAIARQGLNAVLAFQSLLKKGIAPGQINSVAVFVPAQNLALLTRAIDDNRLTRLCNMGFQIACAALSPDALYDPERSATPPLLAFASKVIIEADNSLDAHLPDHWAARVVVKVGQDMFEETLIHTDFDMGSSNHLALLRDKWRRLAPDVNLVSATPAELWRDMLRHVRMPAQQ